MASYVTQHSTSTKSNSLKKGNLVFGNEEVNYGPTSTTGFYTGIDPGLEGFTLILNSNSYPNFHTFSDETDLINYYNQRFTSVATLDNVLTAISSNDNQCLIGGLNVSSSITMGTNQEAVNLTSSPEAQGEFMGLQGPNSNLVPQNCLFWVAMITATVDYVAIYPGTIISEINGSSITTRLSSTSTPVRGTLSITSGRTYTSNKPVHFGDQGNNNYTIAPISYRGNILAGYGNRDWPATYRIYCHEDNTDIEVFAYSITGINSILVDSSSNLSQGTIESYSISDTYDDVWIWIKSNNKISGTVQHGGNDKYILPPVSSNYIYRRYNEHEETIYGGNPSFVGTYVIQDDDGAAAVSIADAAGGEAEAGMPLDFLTDTYAFGSGELDSYFIVSPYTNTVTVSYYSNSVWTQYGSHVENGTLTSPSIHSEGNQAGGTPLVPDLGAVPWKFEGTNPFYIVTNDGSADEEALIGWNRAEPIYAISY
mgnify:FL=1|tara:strand:+ start:76 stop:1518 length:1443 start_codon:yes stop_codon:yes gene_type:complete